MQVWTGALMRLRNEAQLASVIGHEIGHYLRRHSVDRFRDAKDKTTIATVVGMGLNLARIGNVGTLTNLIMVASVLSFGRDQEREADRIGLDLLAKRGYDPGEAATVWTQLLAERNARESDSGRDLIFASHPGEEEREETLREAAGSMPGVGDESRRYRPRYEEALRAHRARFFADELRLRHYGPSLALFSGLLKQDPQDGEVAFYAGEVLRLRAGEGDHDKALGFYQRAIDTGRAPPEVWRGVGLVCRERQDLDAARAAFARYLELRPDAEDALIIRTYL
jgi:tetratricopeptide (TPR) repeat protein